MAERITYGKLVDAVRKDCGLTFSEYCRLMRVNISTESEIETGKRILTSDHVERVIRFFSRYGYELPELRIIGMASAKTMPMKDIESETKRLIISKLFYAELNENDLDRLDIVITEFLKYSAYIKECARQRQIKSRRNKSS